MEDNTMVTDLDGVTKRYETWGVYDERLPKNEDLMREPPDEEFIKWMNVVQLEPIGMGEHDTQGFFIIFGRKRLKALRILSERQEVERLIDVCIFEHISYEDADILILLENNHRSSNELADYQILYQYLTSDPNPNYSVIGKKLGMTAGTVRALDNKWAPVPQWAIEAVLVGNMSKTTAVDVGKIKDKKTQKKLKKILDEEGTLPGSKVKEQKRAIQSDMLVEMDAKLFGGKTKVKEFFPRSDLENILKLLETKTKAEVTAYIESLLAS